MSTYRGTLPEVFPYAMRVSKEDAAYYSMILISTESSFAITVDKPYTLWLSEVSYETMNKHLTSQVETNRWYEEMYGEPDGEV